MRRRPLGAHSGIAQVPPAAGADSRQGTFPGIARRCSGDPEAGAFAAGIAVGLIDDLPGCRALIDGIVQEAGRLIRGRLSSLVES